MSKRAAGEGSIYRRKSDGKWVGAVHLGYAEGRRRRKVVYGRTQRHRLSTNQAVASDSLSRPTFP